MNERAARANLRRIRETEDEIVALTTALESDRLLSDAEQAEQAALLLIEQWTITNRIHAVGTAMDAERLAATLKHHLLPRRTRVVFSKRVFGWEIRVQRYCN